MVDELKQVFNSASIVIVSQNKGLTVAHARDLRKQVKAAGSKYRVTKNSLTKIAAKGTEFEALTAALSGPTSIAYSDDPVAIAKVLVGYAKGNEKIQVIAGVMNGSYLDENALKQLATLPSLDELRGKIVGLLQAPASKVAAVLQAPALQLARVTAAYAKK